MKCRASSLSASRKKAGVLSLTAPAPKLPVWAQSKQPSSSAVESDGLQPYVQGATTVGAGGGNAIESI